MKTVNKLDLIYRKLLVKAQEQRNETTEISDEEYDKYYLSEYRPEPLPDSDIPIPGEEDPNHDYSQDYLTFEALEDGTFSFTINGLYYSINNGASWKSLSVGTNTELISAGTKVLWKRDLTLEHSINNGSNYYIGTFSSTGKFNASGNILSLLYTNNFTEYNYVPTLTNAAGGFWDPSLSLLFKNCINLISAKNLIMPIIRNSRWTEMFANCTNLLYAPTILPATKLGFSAYEKMFYNCSSLIIGPQILADSYSSYSCREMFSGCESLKYIKCTYTNKQSDSFNDWVKGVGTGGTFIKNQDAIFDTGDSGIPAGWEVIDEVVPEE